MPGFPMRSTATIETIRRLLNGDQATRHAAAESLVAGATARTLPDLIVELRLGGRLTTDVFDALADAYQVRMALPTTREVPA